MRFDEDHLQVQYEAGVAQDAAVCAWLIECIHWGRKNAPSLCLTDPTANMPFVTGNKHCCFVELLAISIAELGDSDTAHPASFVLFLFSYPYDGLWFIHRMEFCCRIVDLNVRLCAHGERRLNVPWQCVDIIVIPFLFNLEVFLPPSMVKTDDREGLPWLLVLNASVSAYYSGLPFNQGAATRLAGCIAKV